MLADARAARAETLLVVGLGRRSLAERLLASVTQMARSQNHMQVQPGPAGTTRDMPQMPGALCTLCTVLFTLAYYDTVGHVG